MKILILLLFFGQASCQPDAQEEIIYVDEVEELVEQDETDQDETDQKGGEPDGSDSGSDSVKLDQPVIEVESEEPPRPTKYNIELNETEVHFVPIIDHQATNLDEVKPPKRVDIKTHCELNGQKAESSLSVEGKAQVSWFDLIAPEVYFFSRGPQESIVTCHLNLVTYNDQGDPQPFAYQDVKVDLRKKAQEIQLFIHGFSELTKGPIYPEVSFSEMREAEARWSTSASGQVQLFCDYFKASKEINGRGSIRLSDLAFTRDVQTNLGVDPRKRYPYQVCRVVVHMIADDHQEEKILTSPYFKVHFPLPDIAVTVRPNVPELIHLKGHKLNLFQIHFRNPNPFPVTLAVVDGQKGFAFQPLYAQLNIGNGRFTAFSTEVTMINYQFEGHVQAVRQGHRITFTLGARSQTVVQAHTTINSRCLEIAADPMLLKQFIPYMGILYSFSSELDFTVEQAERDLSPGQYNRFSAGKKFQAKGLSTRVINFSGPLSNLAKHKPAGRRIDLWGPNRHFAMGLVDFVTRDCSNYEFMRDIAY